MASYYWIKLYHEILDDPKMGRLSDRLWRRTVEMFLMAGRQGGDGELPSISDMAWTLRLSPDELQADLDELEKVGIIRQDDGDPFVVHFAERQAPDTPAERKRRQRERERHEQYDPSVTNPSRNVTGTDTNRTAELELDKIREDQSAASPSADADPPPPPVPSTFPEWQQAVRETKNRPAVLRQMCEVLYPGLDPPDYGYIGKVARKVGGAGRLADLLWQHSPHPPTGDLLAYIQNVAKGNGNGRTEHKTVPKPEITGWEDCIVPGEQLPGRTDGL